MSITSLYFKGYSSGTPSGWSNPCPDMQMYGKYLCNMYGGMYLSHVRTVIMLHSNILVSFILLFH